ncbi:HECT-domain-containing protein [Rickenella mellea]|uniref:HECT-type E3 ubiquitin transferase n=1 Tax=Rickenella mellea TaxID=50990 RepID=A0A4Y7QMD6_9AGAM|nr:HECT-domain-containing protein [Rickenella mellea]
MLPLFGGDRRRREINLGGASSAASHAAILDKAKANRNERQNIRIRQESALKLQAWWRGRYESRCVKEELKSRFDCDIAGINGMRCLLFMGRDEERLGRWSLAALANPQVLHPEQGSQMENWLVLIPRIAVLLLQSVANDPTAPSAIAHLRVLHILLISSSSVGGIAIGPLTVTQHTTAYLVQNSLYQFIATAIVKIPPDIKSAPALPLLTAICTVPFSTWSKDSPEFVECFTQTILHIFTIPLLPNRLPLASLTSLSAQLPLASFELLSPTVQNLGSSLSTEVEVHLLANLIAFTPARYSKLNAAALDVYLTLLTKLFYDLPLNVFEPPRETTVGQGWLHEPDEFSESEDTRIASLQDSKPHRSVAKLVVDAKTRLRMQTVPSASHLAALLNVSSKYSSTRLNLFGFCLAIYTAWPTKRPNITMALLGSTGGNLVKELYRGYVRGSSLGRDDDQRQLTDPRHSLGWPPLLLLTEVYTQSLLTMGDDEFFSGSSSVSSHRNPLTLDELTSFSRQLLNIAFALYWQEDQANVQTSCVAGTSITWTAVREKATKCLQAIHARDSRRPFTPPNHWLVTSQIDMTSFVDAAVFEEQEISEPSRLLSKRQIAMMSPRLGVLNNIPFAIPFEIRVAIFRHFIRNDMINNGNYDYFAGLDRTRAVVRRGHIATDGFDKLGNANLKGRVEITFIDQFGQEEAGIDGGGVFKEFFTSLCKEVFDSDRGLWLATKKNELYPNPHSYAKEPHSLEWYRFIGRILGKALYEGILIDVAFAGFFLAKWLGKQSFLDDLASLDPELYQGLIFLKHYSGDPEELSLNFTVADDEFGVAKSIDLIPNGSNAPVTRDNRLQYIYLVSHYRLTKQIRPQSEAFFQGLSEMIDPKWLRMFNQQELQVLIGGVNSAIDLDDLRNHTNYGGLYQDNEPTIEAFWKVVNSFNHEQRRTLLRFATSCSRPPLLGFKELTPNFSIRDAGNDQNRLPSASTCVNLLKLPRYTNENTLREKLLQAIQSGAGFDLS